MQKEQIQKLKPFIFSFDQLMGRFTQSIEVLIGVGLFILDDQ